MRRLIETETGRIAVVIDPIDPNLHISVFDEQGELVREVLEPGSRPATSRCISSMRASPTTMAPRLSEELAARHEKEWETAPRPWVPRGCLRGTAYAAATLGVWLAGVGFLVWLLIRLL